MTYYILPERVFWPWAARILYFGTIYINPCNLSQLAEDTLSKIFFQFLPKSWVKYNSNSSSLQSFLPFD